MSFSSLHLSRQKNESVRRWSHLASKTLHSNVNTTLFRRMRNTTHGDMARNEIKKDTRYTVRHTRYSIKLPRPASNRDWVASLTVPSTEPPRPPTSALYRWPFSWLTPPHYAPPGKLTPSPLCRYILVSPTIYLARFSSDESNTLSWKKPHSDQFFDIHIDIYPI